MVTGVKLALSGLLAPALLALALLGDTHKTLDGVIDLRLVR